MKRRNLPSPRLLILSLAGLSSYCDRQASKWDKVHVESGKPLGENEAEPWESGTGTETGAGTGTTPAPSPNPTPRPAPSPSPSGTPPADPSLNTLSAQLTGVSFSRTATVTPALAGTYLWEQTSGPGVVTFTQATDATTDISANTDGAYTVRVTYTRSADSKSTTTSFTLTWDATFPPGLTAFTAIVSTQFGIVNTSLTVPGTTTDIDSISLRRKAGATAPTTCTDGIMIKRWTAPFSSPVTLADFTNDAGGAVSYRVCIADAAGNITSGAGELSQNKTTKAQPVFLTSTQTAGLIGTGGITQADAYCATLAASSTLTAVPAETHWKALLSTSTMNVKDRVRITGLVTMPDYQNVATSRAQFWSSALNQIDGEETGGSHFDDVWTASTAAGGKTGTTCLDWTSNSAGQSATSGDLSGSTYSSIVWQNAVRACNNSYRLYCLAQPPDFTTTLTGTSRTPSGLNLTAALPDSVHMVSQLTLKRLAGSTAPDFDCSNGTTIYSSTSATSAIVMPDATATTGLTYSYRLCLSDSLGNFLAQPTATGLTAN